MEPRTHILIETQQELTNESIQKRALSAMLRDGEHMPTVFVEGTRGNATVLLTAIPEEGPDKQRYFFLKGMDVSQASTHIGVVLRIYLVMVGWVGTKKWLQNS